MNAVAPCEAWCACSMLYLRVALSTDTARAFCLPLWVSATQLHHHSPSAPVGGRLLSHSTLLRMLSNTLLCTRWGEAGNFSSDVPGNESPGLCSSRSQTSTSMARLPPGGLGVHPSSHGVSGCPCPAVSRTPAPCLCLLSTAGESPLRLLACSAH